MPSERDPKEYIRLACELHLNGAKFSEESEQAITRFCGDGEADENSSLYVWKEEDSDEAVCLASVSSPASNAVKSVVFCRSAGDHIHCMTLESSITQAWQLYTQKCFATAVGKQPAVKDKMRALQVALQHANRSVKLPHVELSIHPRLSVAPEDDDDFLNELQTSVSQWISQIRTLTVLPTESELVVMDGDKPNPESVGQEVTFWTQLQEELSSVQEQLKSNEVQKTLNILRGAKRFVATVALENNTNLEQAVGITDDIVNFLRGYPDIMAATDWNTIGESVSNVFDHFAKKIRSSRYYDLVRCAALLEATTVILRDRILQLLKEHKNLLFVDFSTYQETIRYPVLDIFVRFQEKFEGWKDHILDQGRRRKVAGLRSHVEAMQLHHEPLKHRLDQLDEFRQAQETLRQTVHTVLRQEEPAALQQVEQGPRQIFSSLDVLDLSAGGKQALDVALEEYDLQTDALEDRLARLLREKLQACQDAEDMLKVFARFNLLLTRPRVRAAVKEFQMQLISTVAEAVQKLQSKFTRKYEDSPAARISRLRGIPPVAGKILWARQMERQVNALMEQMGSVLGPNWGLQLEGRQLSKSGDELLAKLDARGYFRSWVNEWEKDIASVSSSKLHSYPVVIDSYRGEYFARVNFDAKTELLFKEIRYLKWLGFTKDIPKTLITVSNEALARYPHAVAIKTALRSYQAVRVLVTPELEPLVMPQLLEIRETLSEAFDVKLSSSSAVTKKGRIRWDVKSMDAWVLKLCEAVAKFEDRVEQLLRACDKVDIALNLLERVEYSSTAFQGVLNSIQKTIDEMSLSGYSDLDSWLQVVSGNMSDVLAKRLGDALSEWNRAFVTERSSKELVDTDDGVLSDEHRSKVDTKVHVDIILRNQEIRASPSLPTARALMLDALHDFMGIVCNLPLPRSGRFEVFDSTTAANKTNEANDLATFRDLVTKIPVSVVAEAYGCIESHIAEAATFVDQWLSYQTLWDTQVADVASTVGDDLQEWIGLLQEASDARATLDTEKISSAFGPFVIRYGNVRSQINLKYDSWQKELQSCFADVLAQSTSNNYSMIVDAKDKLEATSLDSVSTDSVVLGVTFIQEMKQKSEVWKKNLTLLSSAEKILKSQRYVFSNDWMEASVCKGLFESLRQVLERRSRTMDQQIPILQARVNAEDKSASKQLSELLEKWDDEKPLRGNIAPPLALERLTQFEMSLNQAQVHEENLVRAKDALGLDRSGGTNRVATALNELADLKEVWDAIVTPYEALEKIKETKWSTVVMRKVKRSIEDILASMRSLPNRIRQYDAYTHLHDKIKEYSTGYGLMTELKSEALKERHWSTILQRLGIRLALSDLSIGGLWDHGVLTRKKEVAEILTVAQGEMALEVFLGQVRDRWTKQDLELVLFQNRTRLIRGWDDLFATLDDHIGGLALMKSSPYYRAVREFQEEGKLWEERLTKLRAAFDAWVDVQRRWVYLEGILFGSSEIKAQLPSEWSRFKSVDSEFIALMRRIAAKPTAMEVLNIDNIQRTLERLGSLMGVIQRALGEYLAKQRSDFSRFYFLGDDDLLEIMGNSSEPGKVLAHVGKMFAGIAGARSTTVDLPEDVITRLDAMVSKDGELVLFNHPIDITFGSNVKDWLKDLEHKMKTTLADLLESAVKEDCFASTTERNDDKAEEFVLWATKFPAQVMILATQVNWSTGVEEALNGASSIQSLSTFVQSLDWKLEVMAKAVLKELPPDVRKKFEQMITELVRQRDVVRGLIVDKVEDSTDFRWLHHLRYEYSPDRTDVTEKLIVKLSNAIFQYGFEYLGIGERLVQTPLTDRCYLTLTQALHFRMGGSPFGPAGTGKTETVKALGAALGRFVLVFNCDETFNFSAMGRLLAGLSQVGAWGCFDEFNRLEERILSAVSQQILTIQRGLLEQENSIELLGRSIRLHNNIGIFITMNPGYEGRSNLPDNLKSLFRSFAMVVPDRKIIAQVMLFSQGIVSAEQLAGKVVELFLQCEEKLSKQRHYDFGLRALKTLLVSAGALKRQFLEEHTGTEIDLAKAEEDALIVGACNNLLPKLVEADMNVFPSILQRVFPDAQVAAMEDDNTREQIIATCKDQKVVGGEKFIQKLLQLKQVIENRHGVMVVGKCGKTFALRVLQHVLERLDGIKCELYVIDPKAITKERLYGVLDGTTLEWTDGVVTHILRRIIDNQKGEAERRHWIVFDGDVDPEWAENLNSVLDDNKLLTLPSGERLSIPDNVRIILEVDSLKHATPATVSRCGMVWFSNDNVTTRMALERMLLCLREKDISGVPALDSAQPTQNHFIDAIEELVVSERTSSVAEDALDFALRQDHVMEPTRERLIHTLHSLLIQGIQVAIEYDENHPDFPMSSEHMEKYAKRWTLHSLLWGSTGSCTWKVREQLSNMLLDTTGESLPDSTRHLFDYRVRVENGEYELWSESVPRMEIESHRVASGDVVITTTDTVRHTDVLSGWLERRLPLLLCGPPGSGKTMTLTSVVQSFQGIVLASLNFSSRTTPEIILKTFSQYCSYVRRGKDIYLEPNQSLGDSSWLVVFCDEVNLPEEDAYGTQRVIMFMRQLVEHGGFWRSDNIWIKINRIQFVGACNPPADAGRVSMSHRFLRHAPLLLVDFPAKDSLLQIYSTFNRGMMKLFPNLKGETDAITEAMVEVYLANQARFTPESQPQYFYSPRELSRWVRGIYESVVNSDQGLTKEEMVRVWTHEGLRLFSDRLVERSDREWCKETIDRIAKNHFAGVDFDVALSHPIYYSTWLSKDTKSVSRGELVDFLSARLRVFYEEELDVELVVFDEVLDHILRIDRVLRQPMGHLLLVGDSGVGKTVLSKFVSWMNGLTIFQIKAHSRYGMEDFNEDLRTLMRRVGVDAEKICFIFDEANVLSSGFIEAINALLASGEVPGLFEGDDLSSLLSSVRDAALKDGAILDSEEEIFRYFTRLVQRNLHVVFTVNPSGGDWKNRATTSPALFNRCVVDWFGTWGVTGMAQVGKEFTQRLDMGDIEMEGGSWGNGDGQELMQQVASAFDNGSGTFRQAVVAALVALHDISKAVAAEAAKEASCITRTFLSPRDYLILIQNFVKFLTKRRELVEDQELHVNAGLQKLKQTQENVAELKDGLGAKTAELRQKEKLANEKLQQMVADQNIAEQRKEQAEKMGIEVEAQQSAINTRKEQAQRDLDEAEPALRSAQESVRGIKKRDLDEVRNLARPPNNVKLTLECVAIMMGETNVGWADIRKVLAKTDFIPTIINFDADKLSQKQIRLVTEKYLDGNPELTSESVTRSSRACGPLYTWAESQIKYSTIYNNIQPLREEVEQLENDAREASEEKERIETEVSELQDSIARYKSDYAQLISDVNSLKDEMESVTRKIERAESLLSSLSQESERWTKSSRGFHDIIKNLVGDGLLLSAFITYAGFFDFHSRSTMLVRWKQALDSLDIEYSGDIGVVESLSTASERLAWQADGLPTDNLSLENGVILEHGTRFPLVIDPSGHAISFVLNKYKHEKIQTTSFLDKAFTKTLSGAVRFGTALLVENVEKIDPILNPILNRELQRTGGRTLVRIGTEEVDFSPKFRLILCSKNPAVKLTPDVCSRVTLLNFTVTPDSLQNQSLSHLVRSLKPELEEKRSALLKLQGEQNVKLRDLEDQMLAKISACEGSILDDDRLVEGMETVMKEGSQVEQQISESEEVMKQVHKAVSQFEPFAMTCREVFVLFEALRELSFLYEFPASTFMVVLHHALSTLPQEGSDESKLHTLRATIFDETVARVGRGLQVEDKIVFSILLARLFSTNKTVGSEVVHSTTEYVNIVSASFGKEFLWQGRALSDLEAVTQNEIGPTIPLMLCSAPGYDVSGRVESMARELGKKLAAVAMGSAEGFETAESMLGLAAKQGTWVMLKNVHLCVDWLRETLVKRLQAFTISNTHEDFRVFITSEINPRLPTSLLRVCDVVVAQAPTGIRASLTRFFASVSKERLSNKLRNRLYLLVGWTHAVIQERLRFVPTGWTQAYEFAEADAIHALDVIDSLLKKEATQDPEKLPWDAIRATLRDSVFGGRVTAVEDQGTMSRLIERLFVPASFNVDFTVVQEPRISLPESTSREACVEWIAKLPEHTPPSWVGLDSSAETEREKRVAESIGKKIALIQDKCDGDN